MKSRVSLLCAAILSLAACNSSSSDENRSPTQEDPMFAGPRIKFQPRDDSYALRADSVKRFAGADKLQPRKQGFKLSGTSIARPKFATSTAPQAMAKLQETAARFFLATNRMQDTTVDIAALEKAKPRSGLPFLALPLAEGVVAAAFPESTGLLLRHPPSKLQHATSVKDSTEAVNTALGFIADHSLLSLQNGEALDVINVQAVYQSETDEAGFGQVEKVAHHVVFGRTYKGVPIDGGFALVVLDSDGGVSTFQKAWRDIIGEDQIKLASEATIQSRRDPDKVAYLIEKEQTCALTEDSDLSMIHDAAGVGCKFTYTDPVMGAGSLSHSQVEWVNAADDATIPLKGKKPAKPVNL